MPVIHITPKLPRMTTVDAGKQDLIQNSSTLARSKSLGTWLPSSKPGHRGKSSGSLGANGRKSHYSHIPSDGSDSDNETELGFSQWPPSNEDLLDAESKKPKETSGCNFSFRNCIKGLASIVHGPKPKNPSNRGIIDYFVHQLEDKSGKIQGTNPALITKSKTYTYKDVDGISDQIADILKSLLLEKFTSNPDEDVVIGIAFSVREQWILTVIAILKLGHCFLPIDYLNFPAKRIVDLVTTIRPILVITSDDPDTKTKFKPVLETKICEIIPIVDIWDKINMTAQEDGKKLRDINRFREIFIPGKENVKPVAIYYKFGISGAQGVRISNDALWNRINWEWNTFPYGKDEILISQSPIHDIGSMGEIFCPLLAGKPIIVSEYGENLNQLILDICNYKVTRVSIVPKLLEAMLVTMTYCKENYTNPICNNGNPLQTVKLWLCYTTALKGQTARQFFTTFSNSKPKLILIYGVIETLNVVSYKVFSDLKSVMNYQLYETLPTGQPAVNTRIYICDPDPNLQQKPVKQGDIGEIYVSGVQLESGYTGSLSKTQNKIDYKKKDNDCYKFILKTGEFGKMTPGSCFDSPTLIVTGSPDFEMEIDNQRMNTKEIYFLLKDMKEIRSCHVVVYKQGTVNQAILAFASINDRFRITSSTIMDRLRETIPEYMMPILIITDKIFYNEEKEVDSFLLMEEYYKDRERERNFEDFKNKKLNSPEKLKAAKDLFEIMFEVTGMPKRTITYHMQWSIFQLRARLINVPNILVRLKRTGYTFTFEELIETKTVREVIDKMSAKRQSISSEQKSAWAQMFNSEIVTEKNKLEVLEFLSTKFTKDGGFGNPLYDTETQVQTEWNFHSKLFLWELIVLRPVSVAVRRSTDNKIVACSINIPFDSKAGSKGWQPSYPLKYIFDFVDRFDKYIQNSKHSIKDMEKTEGETGVLGTGFIIGDPQICDNYDEAVTILDKLFTTTRELGLNNGFKTHSIITFDYIIQTTAMNSFGYKLISCKQLNCFESHDGIKPFKRMSDYFIGKLLIGTLSKPISRQESFKSKQRRSASLSVKSFASAASAASATTIKSLKPSEVEVPINTQSPISKPVAKPTVVKSLKNTNKTQAKGSNKKK